MTAATRQILVPKKVPGVAFGPYIRYLLVLVRFRTASWAPWTGPNGPPPLNGPPPPPPPYNVGDPWARAAHPHSPYYYNPQTVCPCPGCFSACRRRFSTGIEIPVGIGSGGDAKHGKRCFGGRLGWCSRWARIFFETVPWARGPKTVQNRENHGFFGVSSDLATSGE